MVNKLFRTGFTRFFIVVILVVILISVFLFLFLNAPQYSNHSTICNKSLTDREYLKHMISHHQVAVDMSYKHLDNTHNPQILHLLTFKTQILKLNKKLI